MNKKLLAAAIAAAVVAAPAAFAEATLYGKFHTSIDNQDLETGGDVDNWATRSRSSRVGVKGSEDLGGGLKAIYQLEMQFNSDGGGDQGSAASSGGGLTSQRNTFVGLSGGFGTFLVGRHDTPAKIAFYGAGNERLGDSIIDLNGTGTSSGIGVFHEFRANNAIAYVSPSFSGFTLAAAIIPGEQSGEESVDTSGTTPVTRENDNDGIADHYSLGLIYKGNGFKASIGYENKQELDNIVGDDEADFETLQVGASYTMNNFSIGAHWEDSSDYRFTEGTDYQAWAITGKATFGNNAISLVWTDAETDPDGSNNDIDKDGWGVAAEHNFSKRTKAYVAYASSEIDYDSGSDEDNDVFSLGMIHNF